MGSYTGLLNNAALLMALGIIYDSLGLDAIRRRTLRETLSGLLVGLLGIAVMLSPWELTPGIFFDTRWVLLSLCALFFGLTPTLIAVAMTVSFRLFQGGTGALVGSLVIVVTSGVGLCWRKLERSRNWKLSWWNLYLFGVLVQVAMLACMFLMPAEVRFQILVAVAPPILLIYPLGTMLLGLILRRQRDRRTAEETRRKTDEALIRERSFLRSLIDSADDAIYFKDTQGLYLGCNKASEKLIGLSEAEQIGKSDFDLFDRDFAESIQKKDRVIFAGGKSVRAVELLTSAAGGPISLDSIKTPIYQPDGQLIGLVGISRDISEFKQAEAKRLELENQLRQKYKMEAVGIMAGGIAHDFNNILAIIMANLALIRRKIGNDQALLPRLEQANAAASRASDLVKQILTYSRQEKQNYQPLQFAIIVEESLKLLRSVIPASVEILTQIDGDARTAKVAADSTQIEEVLINLCHNAIYAMGEKGLLKVSLEKECLETESFSSPPNPPAGDYLKLTVADTGAGMSPGLIEKIFDPFFTTKPVGQGTGMGLSICHNIVKKHHGYLRVESIPDQGSTFSAYFPIALADQDSKQKPVPETVTDDLSTGSERILLIDDEELLAVSVGEFLADHGYSVTTQTDSRQALALFKSNPDNFDLVITDQTMPGLTGKELTIEILNIKPKMPIILCTGYSASLTEEKAKELGIKAFFPKPVELPILAQKARSILDGAKG